MIRTNITFLLPSKGRIESLKKTIDNIVDCCEKDGVTFEIIVIYHPQDKTTRKYAKNKEGVIPFSQENNSMTKAVNGAYTLYSKARYITFWSDDLVMYPGILRDSVDYLEAGGEDVPCVGVVFPTKTLNCSFSNQALIRYFFVRNEIKHLIKGGGGEDQIQTSPNPYYRPGGAFPVLYYGLLKTEIFTHIGMLDERFTGYGSDDDMVMKMQTKGFHVHVMYEHFVEHIHNMDKTKTDNMKNTQPLGIKLMREKWGIVDYMDCVIT